ncbi:MAG: ABC transporter substrate-binding protein [Clostridiales bacterium]|nr:ABC transporter substrate-binding protein [Clostridiales bacterium]
MMNKWCAAVLALLLALPVLACAQDTRVFVDDAGREVVLEESIERIAVTGPLGQIAVFAIAPDDLVGLCSEWDAVAQAYIDTAKYDLPVIGQIYGGKGNVNLEELMAADPQVIIDVGEPKSDIAEDLDALQEQTGLPFVHISAYIDSLDKTYLRLGELLGMPEEGRLLSDYCADVYARVKALSDRAQKKRLLYIVGLEGLGVIARNSYHSAVIDMLSDNIAALEAPSSRGTGNEVDMEQILSWNPDVILFSESSAFADAQEDPLWQAVTAVAEDAYYEVPVGPYNWMGFPPGMQRLLGMLWMGKVLYPDEADYDMYEEAARHFELFYHSKLTREQYDALVKNSIGRQSE